VGLLKATLALGSIPLCAAALWGCGDRSVRVFSTEVESVTSYPTATSSANSPTLVADAGLASDAGPQMSGDVQIDDFEDGDQQALATDGWWYVTNDGTSQQSLETVGLTDRIGSQFALHSWGEGFTLWGAFVGLDLGGETGVFDAGWTDAISFWAVSAVEQEVVVRLILQDNSSLQTTTTLQTDWSEHVISFDEFRFEGDAAARVDASRLRHFQLFFGLEAFDVRLDDVVLLDR
jgi:hypothetical protein